MGPGDRAIDKTDMSAALLVPSLQWGARNRCQEGQHSSSRIRSPQVIQRNKAEEVAAILNRVIRVGFMIGWY